MALTQQQLEEQNRLLGMTQFNTGTAKVDTSISSENLAPQDLIKIPQQPVTDYSSTVANTNAMLGANTNALTPTTTDTSTGIEGLLKDYLTQPEPKSAAETYTSLYGTSGIEPKQQDLAAKQQAVINAQAKLSGINARLAGISAEAQAAPIQLQQQVEGRGVTAGGLAPIQAGKLREIALRALPVQAEALGAQAEVAAAQGNAALSESILNQARDHLDRVFQITMTDAQNQYNYKKDLRDKVYQYATAAEKTKLDALQKADDRKFELKKDAINNQQSIAAAAISNGDSASAARITALNPDSPTFQADLARLQGQIKPKSDLQFVSGTANQPAGTFNPKTGVFTPTGGTGASGAVQTVDSSGKKIVIPQDTYNERNDTVNLVNQALNDKYLSYAVGVQRLNPFNYIPGSAAQNVKAVLDQVTAKLALDNRSKLKGSGAISDFESRTLQQAASSFNTSLPYEDARKQLIQIKGVLTTLNGGQAKIIATNPKTGATGEAFADTAAINKMISDGLVIQYSE